MMTLPEFQQLVAANSAWFQGVHRESLESLQASERTLGISLPDSLRWLLSEWGYSRACGLDNLNDAVSTTLECRNNHHLPATILVLNDWHDGGVVWTDRAQVNATGESPIYWSGAHNLLRQGTDEPMDLDLDQFEDYPTWVAFQLEEAQQENL